MASSDGPSLSSLTTHSGISNSDSKNDVLGGDDSFLENEHGGENEDRNALENEAEESDQDNLPNISHDHASDDEKGEEEETVPNVILPQASGYSKKVQEKILYRRREYWIFKRRI